MEMEGRPRITFSKTPKLPRPELDAWQAAGFFREVAHQPPDAAPWPDKKPMKRVGDFQGL